MALTQCHLPQRDQSSRLVLMLPWLNEYDAVQALTLTQDIYQGRTRCRPGIYDMYSL